MTKTTILCDRCHSLALPYRIIMGCEMDPSGNGYNDIVEYMDFCEKCVAEEKLKHPHWKYNVGYYRD